MARQEEIKRDAGLWDVQLEGQYGVTFQEERFDTVSLTVKFFPTKQKAIRAIGLFKYDAAWRALADV